MKQKKPLPTESVTFDERNLRKGEEVMFAFKPNKHSWTIRLILFGGGIPFPVVLIWAVIDFGAMIAIPISTKDYWLWAVLIPFFAVHGAPIWIYLYGIINGIKNYVECGTIITNQRILTRNDRKKPFEEISISQISSVTILVNKPLASSVHIAGSGSKSMTLRSLVRFDAENAVDILHDLKDMESNKKLNERYKSTCNNCGGRVKDGVCVYCNTVAELKNEYADTNAGQSVRKQKTASTKK